MSKPNYRVILSFDSERKVFMARAPELEHCAGEGPTRAEAIARVEEEIDAQLANMLSHGTQPPRSVDEETFSGELAVKVSRTLHRDLAYQARHEGIELDQLVGELLAGALDGRRATHRGSGPRMGGNRAEADNVGNRHDGGPRARGGFGGRGNNMALLDDRASFMEYVRGLESGGGHHARGGGGGGPHGGGGPGGGGDRRRRRRGGGGGGGNGNFRNDGRPQWNNHNGNGRPQHAQAPRDAQAAAPAPAPQAPAGDNAGSHGGGADDDSGNA
jgi:predicted RNase H-like HicB family nuclease